MKWGMVPVREEQLQGFAIWYKDRETDDKTLDTLRNALKKIYIAGVKELGERKAFYTDEYKLWRDERRKGKTIPSADIPLKQIGPSETELLLTSQNKVLEAKLEEARNQAEKHEFTIERLNKIIEAHKKEETSLKRDYAEMCSTSEKYRLIRAGKEKDKQIIELTRLVEGKDEEIANMDSQLKARGRALLTAHDDIHTLEGKVASSRASLQESKSKEGQTWATMREYQVTLEKTLQREAQLQARLSEVEKTHYRALSEANHDKNRLSEQLYNLNQAYDSLMAEQEEWSRNWNHKLKKCTEDKDLWEERSRQIVDGLGNFTDYWLRIFEEARQEMDMYPETQLRPGMKEFYDCCDKLAWKLRRWRTAAATREF